MDMTPGPIDLKPSKPNKLTKASKPIVPKETKKKFKVKDLYAKLSNPIPEQFLVEYVEDNKTFTGYQAQYAINLLNETVGLDKWWTTDEILKQESANGAWMVAMSVQLNICCDEEQIVFSKTGYGASYAKNGANAYKGAKTSAFKNACRYLGIGNELYLKGFEDDIVQESKKPIPEKVSEEILGLEQKIREADNIDQLESLENKINTIEGKAVKSILVKKFNDRKITLLELK